MELEKLAEDWVQKCVFKHPDKTEYPAYAHIGQNIAAQFGANQVTFVGLAKGWQKEVNNYNLVDNSCKNNTMCGHYTQVELLRIFSYIIDFSCVNLILSIYRWFGQIHSS